MWTISKPKWRVNQRRLKAGGGRRRHKARIPGTVRHTRLPGGPGYRNNWEMDKMPF